MLFLFNRKSHQCFSKNALILVQILQIIQMFALLF